MHKSHRTSAFVPYLDHKTLSMFPDTEKKIRSYALIALDAAATICLTNKHLKSGSLFPCL